MIYNSEKHSSMLKDDLNTKHKHHYHLNTFPVKKASIVEMIGLAGNNHIVSVLLITSVP